MPLLIRTTEFLSDAPALAALMQDSAHGRSGRGHHAGRPLATRFRWWRPPNEPAGSVVRVCTLTAGGKVALADRPEPQAAATIVKIQVEITPMCTEFKDRRARTVSDVLGHEATGVVVDPAGSKLVRAGDRVVVMPGNACGHCQVCAQGEHIYCRHPRDVLAETGSAAGTAAYADYMIKPDWLLLRIPADISLKHGSLACCGLGPGLSAMVRMRVTGQDTVLVSGCGPVGQPAYCRCRPCQRPAAAAPQEQAAKPDPANFKIPETEYTMEEVAKHNTKEDLWIVVKGVVLDVTNWLDEHPGGANALFNFMGRDATEGMLSLSPLIMKSFTNWFRF